MIGIGMPISQANAPFMECPFLGSGGETRASGEGSLAGAEKRQAAESMRFFRYATRLVRVWRAYGLRHDVCAQAGRSRRAVTGG